MTKDLLRERAKTHGCYAEQARITQALKRVLEEQEGWARLSDCQRDALEMIARKIGRILAGNPNYADHWVDASGYARLVADSLIKAPEVVYAGQPIQHCSTPYLLQQLQEHGRHEPSPPRTAAMNVIRDELARRGPP